MRPVKIALPSSCLDRCGKPNEPSQVQFSYSPCRSRPRRLSLREVWIKGTARAPLHRQSAESLSLQCYAPVRPVPRQAARRSSQSLRWSTAVGMVGTGAVLQQPSNSPARLLRAFIGVTIYRLCGVLILSMNRCLRSGVRLRAAGRSSRHAAGTRADGLACSGSLCSTNLLLAGRR